MTTMTCEFTIDLGAQFGRFPFGRYVDDGPYSGERFRDEFLRDLLSKHDCLTIDFDNARGVGPSFLDEAFGVLIDEKVIEPAEFFDRVQVISNRDPAIPHLLKMVVRDHSAGNRAA